jgi:2-desacetyl-2-hydroxyethyl bacteriochlorophyllide A dehydrogenase
MRALVAEAADRFEVREVKEPDLRSDEVMVRVAYCTICGSDLKLLRGAMGDIRFPLVPGHEWSGVVVEAPSAHRHLMGRQVVADILQACGGCRYCATGRHNLCPDLEEPGLTLDGAFAEYVAVKARLLHPLPEAIPLREACLIEPLAVVLYALQRLPVRLGQRVAILGGGGIGQLLVQAAMLAGAASVALVDPHPERRALAQSLGADRTLAPQEVAVLAEDEALRPDLVFDAAGRAAAFRTALEVAAPGARVGALGYSGSEVVALEPSIVMRKLLDIRGVLSPTGTWTEAVDLVARGHIRTAPLLTHDFRLQEFPVAFRLAAERRDGAVRVVVQP